MDAMNEVIEVGRGTKESGEPLIDPISFQVPGGEGCEALGCPTAQTQRWLSEADRSLQAHVDFFLMPFCLNI